MNKQRPTWGLVLSGGAAYGLANAGVVDVLGENNLRPDSIAGSSMGAIIGALVAMGFQASELRKLCDALRPVNIAKISNAPMRGGLHGGLLRQQLEKHLYPVLADATIGDCKIPFVCVAGRVKKPLEWSRILRSGFTEHALDNIEPYVFPSETRLLDAILASSAIPVVFSPVTIGENSFVDLIHFGAIPARTLERLHSPDVIIATDTNPRYDGLKKFLPKPWQAFLVAGYDELEKSRQACDLIIEPAMPAAVFRFDKSKEFWKAGREAAEKAMPRIKELLPI